MMYSNSRIQCFKNCRRMFELRYIEDVVPVKSSEAIERGLSYHQAIENILSAKGIDDDTPPKVVAMAMAFDAYIKPNLPAIADTEKWFEYDVGKHSVRGRLDAVTVDGEPVEHKTTSSAIDESYWFRLEFDEQIATYLLATGKTDVWYTVCRTPTIRQKQNESDEEFLQRCIEWYDTDTDEKIAIRRIHRDLDDLVEFQQQQEAVIKDIESCGRFYRNPSYCMRWGKMCEYAPICKDYDASKTYIEFERRTENDNKT